MAQNHKESVTRVLVLDDEESIRELIKAGLGDLGCEVQAVGDGRGGLQLLLDHDFDVAIVDLKMREMDGFAFLTEALRMRPWMGVVIISGFLDDATKYHAGRLGVRHILAKPFDMKALRDAVREETRRKEESIKGRADGSLERFQYEMSILRNLTRTAIQSQSLLRALQGLSVGFAERLPAAAVGILTVEDDEPLLSLFLHKPVAPKFLEAVEDHMRSRYYALSGKALPEEVRRQVAGEACSPEGARHPRTCHAVPIISASEVLGLLTLASESQDAYSEADMSFLYHAANHLATVLVAFRRIRQLAIRDGLTDLYNRRHVLEELEYIRQMAKRYGFPIGVVIVDVDHFKKVNDTYGHLVGDEVLVGLATLLRESVTRAADVVGRYGGDELIVVLPGAGLEDAWAFGERLLSKVRAHVFRVGGIEMRLAVSVGVTSVEGAVALDLPPNEILSQADQALYTAKGKGRDCMCAWSDGVSVLLDKDRPAQHLMGWLAEHGTRDSSEVARRAIVEVLTETLTAGQDLVGGHSAHAREMALMLGKRLGMSDRELRDLGDGAVLHDLGKIAVPSEILAKKGPLTDEEWSVMKRHPEFGYEILRPFEFLAPVAEIVLSHQERYDGSGYPRGLKGDETCLGGRIIAVLDAYEAMRADRSYRCKRPREEAVEAIRKGSGTQFDPKVVDAFLKSLPAIEKAGEEERGGI